MESGDPHTTLPKAACPQIIADEERIFERHLFREVRVQHDRVENETRQ